MKQKLRAFFSGRNGMDSLSVTISWVSVIVLLISMFVGVAWLQMLLYLAALAGIVYAYFRAFSRNVGKRQAENLAFRAETGLVRQRWQQRKTHKFYHCPKCRTILRVPKGKGKISITCRCCGEKFIRKT